MTATKTDAFTPEVVQLAKWAKALGHPARIAILQTLAKKQTCLCGEIVEELPLAQATVSQHLKALKEAGLIQGQVDGPRVCYCPDRDALNKLHEVFDELFDGLNCSCSCCG